MDDTSKLEFSQARMTIKMTSKESPATLFTQISTLQNRYGIYDTDEQLLACIANALPREYKAILAVTSTISVHLRTGNLANIRRSGSQLIYR
jgi:hypothetical protein